MERTVRDARTSGDGVGDRNVSREQLQWLVLGHRPAAAIAAAVELGLVDLLAERPRTATDLAEAAGTDPDTTGRLLRALVTVDLVEQHAEHRFALTELGAPLRSDAPASLRAQALLQADPAVWAAWGHLAHSVRTGENAFTAKHGTDVWAHRADHPEHNASFNALMASRSEEVAGAVAASYDFSGLAHVVDVGGGRGVLLAAILRAYPHLTGTVFDLEHAVADVPPPGLESRWSAASGSFFESVPSADGLLLKSILHDWPDERCIEILRTCRRGLRSGGVVLVVEQILGHAGYERDAAFSDLNMLVMPGGRERTEQEYAALFAAAGLRLTAVVDTAAQMSVLEARSDAG